MNFSDREELSARQKRRVRQRRKDIVWNLLTAILLIATVVLAGFMLLVFSNPRVPFNPFPPPTLPVEADFPTETSQAQLLPETETATIELTPTRRPTNTGTPVPEPTQPPVLKTTSAPITGSEDYPYTLRSQPSAMINTLVHADGNCDWQGVGGTVVDLQGRPVQGVLVILYGTFDGRKVEMNTLSGQAEAWYGESGFEFVLGIKPIASSGALYIQLLNQSLQPISDRFYFDTFDTCDRNLVLINFKQVR